MKKISQILILAIAVLISAQGSFAQESKTNVDNFWGIKFGSSVAEAKKIILAKKTGTIDEKRSSETSIVIDSPDFAGKTPLFIILQFINDKFHTAKVAFRPSLEAKTFELYDSIKKDINDKYYKTDKDYKFFKSPYYDGDGFETQAIRVGKGTVEALWTFKPSESQSTTITLEIDTTLVVLLNYQDDNLIKEAIEKQKTKNAKDY